MKKSIFKTLESVSLIRVKKDNLPIRQVQNRIKKEQ